MRPSLEMLEDRLTPAVLVVNTSTDSPLGTGSGLSGDLRYCVNQANRPAHAGANSITFEPATITLTYDDTNNPGAFGPTA